MLESTACQLRVGAARRLLSKRPTPLSAASPGGSASATPRHCTGPSAPGLAQPRSCTASTSAASRPDPAATIRTSDPPRDSSALAYVAAIARACRQCRCRRRLGTGAPRTPRAGRRTRRRRDQPRCPAPPYRRVGPDLPSSSPQRYPAVNTPSEKQANTNALRTRVVVIRGGGAVGMPGSWCDCRRSTWRTMLPTGSWSDRRTHRCSGGTP